MSKHPKNSPSLQLLHSSRSIPIEIPLPMLAALEGVENAFFELCVAAGRQVLDLPHLLQVLEAVEAEESATVETKVA